MTTATITDFSLQPGGSAFVIVWYEHDSGARRKYGPVRLFPSGSPPITLADAQTQVDAWIAQADRAGEWLSGTLLNGLEESYAPRSGLAAVVESTDSASTTFG